MSGEASGLILIPVALAAMPMLIGGLAIAGAVAVGVKATTAAVQYERQQRRRREEISQSSAARGIGDFRGELRRTMEEQNRLNVKTSDQMMKELERQRNAIRQAAERQDAEGFAKFAANMKNAHRQVTQNMADAQNRFTSQYRRRMAESMETVSSAVNRTYAEGMEELRQLQNDAAAKENRAREMAETYIEEFRTLTESLRGQFQGEKFRPAQLMTLESQLEQAVSLYNKGLYEACIAAAKDGAVNSLEEIYEADALAQEWDNYYKMALVLSEEVKSYIESQAVITEGAKDYAEKATGQTLESEIVGVRVADYTDKNAKGQTRYDYLLHRATELYEALRRPDAERLTTAQLKESVEFLNNELYPSIVRCVNKAVINMNNAFSRQNISEEIIDFFEEHNFSFAGFAYDDDSHDKALHIGLESEATGEELIVTLAPELLNNGDIQTRVDLKQTKGDAMNEERKAYYRECVQEVVTGNHPGAKVELKCNAATRNRLSSDTETKKKLRQ